jgi:ATP-dependent DNA helicase RecG
MNSNTPISEIKGVGEKTRKLFEKMDIRSIGDLVLHYPRDYRRYEMPVTIRETEHGRMQAVRAAVANVSGLRKVRNLTILTITVRDSSGEMTLTFFNQPYLRSTLKAGGFYVFYGRIERKGTTVKMEQAKVYSYEDYLAMTRSLQPVYSLTKGLKSSTVTKSVHGALDLMEWDPEMFDGSFLEQYDLISHKEAVRGIHDPLNDETLSKARKRLAFEDFFFFLLLMRKNKDLVTELPNQYPMLEVAETERLIDALPYRLTAGQKKTWNQIKGDLSSDICMNRLVQGDVGSGKTIVALLALLMTACNGYQGALMAPTEVLAVQHLETVKELAAKYGVPFRPQLLVGSMTAAAKREARERIASGDANLVIGTHALIQDKVEYQKLALVVTDEQHRFGVRQREALAEKGKQPHILVMSATPIPRTLAIVLYGDLQVSAIRELPSTRLPIKNCVVGNEYRPTAYKFIADQVQAGRQAYVICPMVEAGDNDELENVQDYCERLRSSLPASVRVDYLHGRMNAADKTRIMNAFAANDIHVLVSTTVIEVGINVPNATVMMVENAERFGLSQLHQLRGRVGRGSHQSYCIFLSAKEDEKTMERLKILNESNNGFDIANEDLRLRGPGEFFGVRQSGEFAFQVADLYSDADVLTMASEAVEDLLKADKHLQDPGHFYIRKAAMEYQTHSVDFTTI